MQQPFFDGKEVRLTDGQIAENIGESALEKLILFLYTYLVEIWPEQIFCWEMVYLRWFSRGVPL